MDKVEKLLNSMNLGEQITLSDIPSIDLYMDQVIQLFDNKLSSGDENEKVLTKTMINNYAKAGLLVPIKNKKYTKEHIILLSLIYQLKGNLKINEIKTLLQELNDSLIQGEIDLSSFYTDFLQLMNKNTDHFSSTLPKHFEEANENNSNRDANDYLEKLLLISSLAQMSNLYRTAAEKLVSEISSEVPKK